MRLAALRQKNSHILHDADSLCDAGISHQPDPALFSAEYWRSRDLVVGEAPGRGSSLFLQPTPDASTQWVLRPYRRGGLIAKLNQSRYLWTGLERTRGFREMRLTANLFEQGLPVPRPIAACVTRHGLSYEAALITQRIPGAKALAELIVNQLADETLLRRVGAMVRRFHQARLDHVDLNARNILVDASGAPWLIDLDRCRLRQPGTWQNANLERLERSIHKFDATLSISPILQGYRATA
ncbi:3-deoxy-D-manno-octulosonic acid kinase [Halomonas llamarensis]|uniref:3-deoxy-D-manno-octulosonic acid kinase n=1 Tax=Halomonas llamarensis TaxID=2945104 RepID=A0ABT0SUV3_9GAMM|nr:3-deoxy-D-manno-octulosonic acid kinase [Halomonas llamarensis]MCL7931492.1 3-deoxy-D-manno-octulosonic acid kinase [Halomonas llamarensis]